MLVKSGTVRRIITPNQALWIPAGTPHAIHFLSETAMRTLYLQKRRSACVCCVPSPLRRSSGN